MVKNYTHAERYAFHAYQSPSSDICWDVYHKANKTEASLFWPVCSSVIMELQEDGNSSEQSIFIL